MLPKKSRIRASSFDALLKAARQVHGRVASLSYVRSDSTPASNAFAVVVSKSVAKHAVDRNRLRRQAYAIIRDQFQAIAPGYACVFFLKKGAKGISYRELQTELSGLLKKSGLAS